MNLVEVKKCEFDVNHKDTTYCTNCNTLMEGIVDTCSNCGYSGSDVMKHEYNVTETHIRENLKSVFVNKDHVVNAFKTEQNEDYYIIHLSNGYSFTVSSEDFEKLK